MTAFIKFLDCTVTYTGRASTTLARGHYLIIYKPDKSLLIHGNRLMMPMNYLGTGTEVQVQNGLIMAQRKAETIKIEVHAELGSLPVAKWDYNRPELQKSERQMKDWIVEHIYELIESTPCSVEREVETTHGVVDIVARAGQTCFVIEAKRRTASVSAASQLARYGDFYRNQGLTVKEILVAPRCSPKCSHLLISQGQTFYKLDFETVTGHQPETPNV